MTINNSLFTNENTKVEQFGDDRYLILSSADESNGSVFAEIKLQSGPVKEAGVNGCFPQDLLLIVLTRLQEYQKRHTHVVRTLALSPRSRKLSCGLEKGQMTGK